MPEGRGEGAQAERKQESDEGVEEGEGEDVQDEVEGEMGVPWGRLMVVGGGRGGGHGVCFCCGEISLETEERGEKGKKVDFKYVFLYIRSGGGKKEKILIISKRKRKKGLGF